MPPNKNRSLLLTFGFLMTSIALLAIASMAASLYIADTVQGQATAINESGALRMRSYRIASSLVYDFADEEHYQETLDLINDFEAHLHSPNLTQALPKNKNHPLQIAYRHIQQQWNEKIQPIFEIYLEGIVDNQSDNQIDMGISEAAVINLRNRYFLVVSGFVDDIDTLVSILETDSETKIKRLRFFQFIALALTLTLIIIALILAYQRVHIPLKQLLYAAERVSKGDFSFRTHYTQNDELGQLGNAFNTMAEDLSDVYMKLENRVQEKTLDLERSNRSMELLYRTVKHLNEAESPHNTFQIILDDIERLINTGKGVICLTDHTKENAAMLASTFQSDDYIQSLCNQHNCKTCLQPINKFASAIDDASNNNDHYISLPISDQEQQYGVLIIQAASLSSIQDWQKKPLQSIAGQIGIALKLSQQAAETRRLSLMEERGAIARELHDSLAQSLTYMKIQVSRLQALLNKADSKAESEKVITELRVGLNSAYKELRELLTTFRLKISGEDFNDALIKTLEEFNQRSETDITCDNKINYFDLTPNEEIHVLQLIREALSNIVQHANASSAKITLQYIANDEIQLTIVDNGRGLPSEKSQTHHYGLSIMKERAKTLRGHFEINNQLKGGVSISLIFMPTNNTAPVSLISDPQKQRN